MVVEKFGHLLRRTKVPLGVDCQQTSGEIKRGLVADRGKKIEDFSLIRSRVAYAIGSEQRQLQRPGNIDGSAIPPFLFAIEVTLNLDVDILRTEDRDKTLNLFSTCVKAAPRKSCCE